MNRSYLAKQVDHTDRKELRQKTAIHEAGHATAIYFGSQQKQLPPVYFQIYITGWHQRTANSTSHPEWLAKIEGGRLIHTLPSSVSEATARFSAMQKQAYLNAFEADIISLMVGPLAEANYIALRDDEIINSRLVNMNALHQYGGTADLNLIADYLNCLGSQSSYREQKISELFAAAFDFINNRRHWRAIMALANTILTNSHTVMNYQEIIAVLDAHSDESRKAA